MMKAKKLRQHPIIPGGGVRRNIVCGKNQKRSQPLRDWRTVWNTVTRWVRRNTPPEPLACIAGAAPKL